MKKARFMELVSELQAHLQDHPDRPISLEVGADCCIVRFGCGVVKVDRIGDRVWELVSAGYNLKSAEEQAKEIYDAYPRKRDRHGAIKAILKAMKDPEIPKPGKEKARFLLEAVRMYAASVETRNVDRDLIPYPATWFRRGSYLNSLEEQKKREESKW